MASRSVIPKDFGEIPAASKVWKLIYKGQEIATSKWSSVLFSYVNKQPASAQTNYTVTSVKA